MDITEPLTLQTLNSVGYFIRADYNRRTKKITEWEPRITRRNPCVYVFVGYFLTPEYQKWNQHIKLNIEIMIGTREIGRAQV